jgi:hypothetical protein
VCEFQEEKCEHPRATVWESEDTHKHTSTHSHRPMRKNPRRSGIWNSVHLRVKVCLPECVRELF